MSSPDKPCIPARYIEFGVKAKGILQDVERNSLKNIESREDNRLDDHTNAEDGRLRHADGRQLYLHGCMKQKSTPLPRPETLGALSTVGQEADLIPQFGTSNC